MNMNIIFTRDEINLMCEALKHNKKNVKDVDVAVYGKARIYGVHWKFCIALSNLEESIQLNFNKDEMRLMCCLLFFSNSERAKEMFQRISETVQNLDALNGYDYSYSCIDDIYF